MNTQTMEAAAKKTQKARDLARVTGVDAMSPGDNRGSGSSSSESESFGAQNKNDAGSTDAGSGSKGPHVAGTAGFVNKVHRTQEIHYEIAKRNASNVHFG